MVTPLGLSGSFTGMAKVSLGSLGLFWLSLGVDEGSLGSFRRPGGRRVHLGS